MGAIPFGLNAAWADLPSKGEPSPIHNLQVKPLGALLFCTPCYGDMVTEAQSCLNLKEELTRVGLAHDWLTGMKESLVTRAISGPTGGSRDCRCLLHARRQIGCLGMGS